jgi:hypothetical protein
VAHGAALVALLLPTARAGADEYSDFRIPDHHVYAASGTFGASARRGQLERGVDALLDRSHDYSGALGSAAFWLHDSERGITSLTGSLVLLGRRSDRTRRSEQFFAPPQSIHLRDSEASDLKGLDEYFAVDGAWRRYPWAAPAAIEISTSTVASYRQAWSRGNRFLAFEDSAFARSQWTGSTNEERVALYDLSVAVTAGVGRVRDATGVYRARLLEQRMIEQGLLVRPLSRAAASRLAALFYVEPGFRLVHDRPERFFWRELERILREDGALAEQGLDAYGVFRALEPAVPTSDRFYRFYRRSGAFAGIALTARHQHGLESRATHNRYMEVVDANPPVILDFADSRRDGYETNLAYLGPRVEYHRPIGMRWQLDAESHAFFALQNARVDDGLDMFTSLSAVWVVSDRWFWSADLGQARHYLTSRGSEFVSGRDAWSVRYGMTLGYLLEDRVGLEIGASEFQYGGRNPSAAETMISRAASIQVGVSYHFLGGLDAPGLIPPVRLQPGGRAP